MGCSHNSRGLFFFTGLCRGFQAKSSDNDVLLFANEAKVSYNSATKGWQGKYISTYKQRVSCTMGKSFQEQLLQLGLVDKKKVSETKKQQHKKKKQKTRVGKHPSVVDENVLLARQAEEKKKARARELNLEREAKLQHRAELARVKQLIEQNRREKDDKGVAYRFNVEGKIQRIFVARDIADQLSDGRLGIVGLGEQFEVIPKSVVEKIQSINDRIFTALNTSPADKQPDPDDPYAGYEVPDDLIW